MTTETSAGATPAPLDRNRRPVGEPPSGSGDGVARGSLLMASGSLASRVLGVFRMTLIAWVFGVVTSAGNAWQVANTLPTTVYMLIAAGVINAVFVPQLTRAAQRPDGGREYVDTLITLALLLLGGATLVAIPLAPGLVWLFAPHDPAWPGATFDLAVAFAYVVLPSVFFYGLYAVLGQVLNAQNKFGAYGWAPALCNVVWLIGLAAFLIAYPGQGRAVEDWRTPMIVLIGGSMTVGVALQALALLIPLLRSGWRYRPRFAFRGVGLGTAGRIATWTVAGIGATQAALAVASQVLNSVTDGHVGRLGFDSAFFLFMTPHGLISVSLATALFTAMSSAAARQDLYGVRTHLRRGLRLIGVATIPVTVAGLCLANAGTAIVFAGNPLEETREVAQVFLVLVLALLPFGVFFLVQRAFYAFEDARTPFYLAMIAAVVFAVGSLAAMAVPSGQRAVVVAIAATLSDVVAAAVGLRWVTARLGGMRLLDVAESWTRALFASLVAGLWTLLFVGILQALLPGRGGAVLTLILGGGVFVVAYLATGRWLRIRELGELLGPVLRRVPRLGAAYGGRGRA
ncbi:MAG: murein biosynthesis integral membrane protein MurJ [Austwickia sp.]|nr:murein biosynthesis integral membrane protein MurJ [Actinomycetota bacterium]MCO5310345.1 murein biosynthesis integral membrane protein MurJ [Austwickia sp.]